MKTKEPRLRPSSGGSGAAAAPARARAPEPRPRSEKLQSALYRIAEKANSAEDLQELFVAIHQILSGLMYAKNCFIALYEPAEQMIHFPYWVDEKDPAPTPTGHRSRKYGRGLTEYVLRTGQPLLLDGAGLQRLIDHKEIDLIGSMTNDWIGVPLKKGDEPFGILVLQSYDLAHRYGEPEKEILTFVSHEIASAIDYRRKRDALEESEKKFRALYRITETASTAQDLDQMYASLHKIIGELMYAANFYIALHDPVTDMITFPYWMDANEPAPAPRRPSRGLTEYVLRSGQPFLSRMENLEELVTQGEVKRIGSPSFDWMGVPLKKDDETFGVLAVQTYDEKIRYGEKDKELLTFVSQHVANALQRRRDQEAVKRSEERYRSLVESAVYGIYRSAMDDRFLDVNPALVEMLGYDSPEEVLALDVARDVYLDPNERGDLVQKYHYTRHVDSVEVKWKRKDGTPMTVRLSGRAVVSVAGEPEGFEMIAEDVTERRAFEEQMRQSQKMEAVGRLAGGVAHDFNNLLTVIKGYTELVLDSYSEGDPRRGEIEEIRKAADRAGALTRQLLAFSRQQVLAPKTLNLNQVVQSMDGLMHRLLGENIELSTLLGPDVGRVRADPGQLEQVLMNLAINARDAMPRGGKLTIGTANAEIDELYAREHPTIAPGSYVLLAVSDTGQGMDTETQAHIFEPFFTTKEQGKGTGLGLSTVYGIVKQSGGDIWVYSEVGVGSTFKVYLPRVDAPAELVAPSSGSPRRAVGSETILLVEDEDGVRALVRKFLERSGYQVIEASSGDQALGLAHKHGDKIDLLLTDVVLPRMSGSELARRLVDMYPQTRVLYMSGYTDDAIVHHGVLSAGAAFVQKPFTAEALGRKIREILESD
ncbi:MAG TPA: GAF domain-containing protein [Terriglobales bacterium]|nr:GAF domain-containing protein [Terriglobales bacterium]